MKTDRTAGDFASASVSRHLLRGALGFGLLAAPLALLPVYGPTVLLLLLAAAPAGLVALRGCPMCWLIGLTQTVSRGRLVRDCSDGVCTLAKAAPN